ncbi:hypothetical protein T4C_4419 [Trichinella pseudospiralis]|uniref:Uncharacterized protein n=1 Tax=Trichinella pseudospiralis TaxID=6337 RepID=A0A0V1GLD7_TRIPS|nr:hypothetical protein T4C_4419 [Trichinella pseudospiralis]
MVFSKISPQTMHKLPSLFKISRDMFNYEGRE